MLRRMRLSRLWLSRLSSMEEGRLGRMRLTTMGEGGDGAA